MTTSRTLQLVLAGILAAATMACGGGAGAESAPADDTPGDAAGAAAVTIDDLAFAPSDIDVPVGGTVAWRNAEDVPHTVTFDAAGVEDSGELGEGDSFSATFSEAGTYDYICAIHPDMTGSVTVQ